MRTAQVLGRAGAAALDALLPPHCAGCDAPVLQAGRLCPDCFRAARLITAPCCERCGAPFASHGLAGLARVCARCEAAPPAWDRARAAFVYDDLSKRLVLPLKYQDRVENAALLARHMARAGATLLAEADLLVPVPLHRWRRISRRYNQAALLARALSRQTGRPVSLRALRRVQPTAMLFRLGAAERRAALAGAIVGRHAPELAGRRVLLIDDVLTSGATAAACAEALRRAGARAVDVLVAARTVSPA